MATCGNCENPDYTPGADCCPDTTEAGLSLDVRDRNCRIKRLVAERGIVAADERATRIKFTDGSNGRPLFLDVEEITGSDGSVLLQTPSGRILAVVPDGESSQLLTLVYDGGQIKFAPVNYDDLKFTDANLPTAKSGFLAGYSCAADGRVQLAKFIPGCEGNRYLVINEAGEVTCDTRETDDCLGEVAEDGIVDYIFGCKDGKIVKIAPEEGNILQYKDSKWEMLASAANEVWVGGTFIYQNDYTSISSPNFGPVVIPFGSGVPSTAKWVQIRIQTHWLTGTTVGIATIKVNDVVIITTLSEAGGAHQGAAQLYVPYGAGSFTLQSSLNVSTAGNTYADGGTSAGILSYR